MTTKKPPLTVVETRSTAVQPPRRLGKHGMALWRDVMDEYRITDRGGIEILAQICAAADRAEALAECIAEDGECVRGKSGIKAHPALREEISCRAFVVRGLERLGLNVEVVKAAGRPGKFSSWAPSS
jgi:hypothetical protein